MNLTTSSRTDSVAYRSTEGGVGRLLEQPGLWFMPIFSRREGGALTDRGEIELVICSPAPEPQVLRCVPRQQPQPLSSHDCSAATILSYPQLNLPPA